MKPIRLAPLLALSVLIAATPAAAQQQAADGERLFRTRCASCHGLAPGQSRIGPPLAGVVGRPAASVSGARYSEALRAAGIVWSPQTLETYLANPRQAVPGTTMTISVRDGAERAALIAYLRTQSTAE